MFVDVAESNRIEKLFKVEIPQLAKEVQLIENLRKYVGEIRIQPPCSVFIFPFYLARDILIKFVLENLVLNFDGKIDDLAFPVPVYS